MSSKFDRSYFKYSAKKTDFCVSLAKNGNFGYSNECCPKFDPVMSKGIRTKPVQKFIYPIVRFFSSFDKLLN